MDGGLHTDYDDSGEDDAMTILPSTLVQLLAERAKQDAKWGRQDHTPIEWLAILTEEVGEFAQEALRHRFGGKVDPNLKYEVVQVAAVAIEIIESLERNQGV